MLGAGIAGLTCARVLVELGWQVELYGAPPPGPPALLLTPMTRALLGDIWRGLLIPELRTLAARSVTWSDRSERLAREPSVVVDGPALVRELEARAHADGVRLVGNPSVPSRRRSPVRTNAIWTIEARGRDARIARAHYEWSGRRHMLVATVGMARSDLARIKAIASGWVFVFPTEDGRGLVQVMLPGKPKLPERRLRELLYDAGWTHDVELDDAVDVRVFTGAPRMLQAPYKTRWIAIGDAAMVLDPICGDGTGAALRGAVLAAAALDAIERARIGPRIALGHYRRRLRAAFVAHLAQCDRLYADAPFAGRGWMTERSRMATMPARVDAWPWRLQLDRFQLTAL